MSSDGVILRSPSGTFALDGRGIAALASQLVDALATTGARSAVLAAVDPALRPAGESFLDLLDRLSLAIECDTGAEVGQLAEWQAAYARLVGEQPVEAARRLALSRVLVVGLAPWAATAARHLVQAGVPAVHLVDDGTASVEAHSPRGTSPHANVSPCPRRALAETLLALTPACVVTHSPLMWTSDEDLDVPSEPWSVIIDAMPGAAVSCHKRLARFAHRHHYTMMCGAVEGSEIVVGPLTVPNRTACWECYRRRRLSSWDQPWVAPALHQFISSRDASQAASEHTTDYLCPPSALDTLGSLVFEEVIKLILHPDACTARGRISIHNFVSQESSSHWILPAPRCDVCGGAASVTCRDAVTQNPFDAHSVDDLLQRSRGIIDSRTGIISAVALRSRRVDEPILPVCAHASVAGHSDGVVHAGRNDEVGGKGLTPVEAMIGAMGEALERYSAAIVDEDRMVHARRAALEGDVIDPAHMHLYTEQQYGRHGFPYHRYCPDREYPWVRGRWLDGSGNVWVPALMVYFVPGSGENHFCQVTSNGLAAGIGDDDAALRATLELIERDAFIDSWTLRRPGIRVRRDEHLQLETRHIMESIERLGADVELYLLPGRVDVPVVLCLGLGDGRQWPAVSVTAAAHWNPQVAGYKAVVEHAYSCVHVRRTMRDNPAAIPKSADDVHTFFDHALYYAAAERRPLCEFWRSDQRRAVSMDDLKSWNDLTSQQKASELTRQGMKVAVVDVTSPDLALTNVRVVRALCETAHQLYCGAGLQRAVDAHVDASAWRPAPNQHLHPMA